MRVPGSAGVRAELIGSPAVTAAPLTAQVSHSVSLSANRTQTCPNSDITPLMRKQQVTPSPLADLTP